MALGRERVLHSIPVFFTQLATRSAPALLLAEQRGEGSPEVDQQSIQRARMDGFGQAAFAFEPMDPFCYTQFSLERIFNIPGGIRRNQSDHGHCHQPTIKHTLKTLWSCPFENRHVEKRLPMFTCSLHVPPEARESP